MVLQYGKQLLYISHLYGHELHRFRILCKLQVSISIVELYFKRYLPAVTQGAQGTLWASFYDTSTYVYLILEISIRPHVPTKYKSHGNLRELGKDSLNISELLNRLLLVVDKGRGVEQMWIFPLMFSFCVQFSIKFL